MNKGLKGTPRFLGKTRKPGGVGAGLAIRGGTFRLITLGATTILGMMALMVVNPVYVKVDSTEATTNPGNSFVTLAFVDDGSGNDCDTASVNLEVTSPDGTFATSTDGTNNTTDQRIKFSIATNNYTGYTLTMSSSSSVLTDGTHEISSISSATTATDFADTGNTGKDLNNKWGFISNYYRTGGNNVENNTTVYLPAPTTATTLRVTNTSNNSSPDNYTIGLGLRADFTYPKGTYTNDTFVLQYVANAATYSITYDKNTTETVSNMPYANANPQYKQVGSVNNATNITLDNTVPTTTNYTFTGWCNLVPTIVDGVSNCTGTGAVVYNPNGGGTNLTYDIDWTASNEATLYAMWTPVSYTTTVNFAGTGVSSVTFTNATHGTATVSTTGGTASLKYGVSYETTMNFDAGYEFVSWALNSTSYGTLSSTSTNPTSFAIKTSSAVITATGQKTPMTVRFKVGEGIDIIIVADGSNKYKPFYATSGTDVVFNEPTEGTTYIVTVVPTANYKLNSWTGDTANLASTTLLTTTYTVPSSPATLTATGTSGSYTNMKDLALNDCSATGTNVTDERDGKSYTVAKFGSYCYMLSNLRLDSNITLESTYSDVKSGGVTYTDPSTGQPVTATTFTTPTEAWTSSGQNYYCKAIMKVQGGEYYYNWYAARANPYVCDSPTANTNATATNDGYSLGSICPKNWTLPTYSDITAATLWSDGANPGMLSTTGGFYSGSQGDVGSYGNWWSSTRDNSFYAYYLSFDGTSAYRDSDGKDFGVSVRCMRSS